METDLFHQSVMNLLGPVEELFDRDDVSEIMINGPEEIYVEREGLIERVDATFPSETMIESAIVNLGQYAGRPVGPEHPILEARMPDGSRVTVVLPPISKRGAVISIRKFTPISKTIEDLIELGAMNDLMREFLRAAILDRKNILISGGAGSGKTTLLNNLSTFIPRSERVVVIEETSELELQQPHVIPMETFRGEGPDAESFDIRRLVKTALRLRPDRIIIGEVRGEEALDLIQAMTVGHAGSMATLHASSPLQALLRLETLLLMAKLDLPIWAIRGQIASSIDLVVQTERFRDGSRRVTSVAEVLEPDERGHYQVRNLIRYKMVNLGAGIQAVGRHHPLARPTFAIAMEEKGLMNFDEFPYE